MNNFDVYSWKQNIYKSSDPWIILNGFIIRATDHFIIREYFIKIIWIM